MTHPRRVVITGGSGGIGGFIAALLARRGVSLVLVGTDEQRLASVLAALPAGDHRATAFDVADPEAWESFGSELLPLAGLVTAAARLGPIGPVGSIDPAEFGRTIDVNLSGTFHAVQACRPHLGDGGAIVTFSGGGATSPLARYDAYACSKAAVVRLTENLAPVLAEDGLRINCVAPGFVATGIHDVTLAAGPEAAGAEYYARTQKGLAAGGVPPADVAELTHDLLFAPRFASVTGRLLSAEWDPWKDVPFADRLAAEPYLGTLRRIDDQLFSKAPVPP